MEKYPKTIYVTRENQFAEDEFFSVQENLDRVGQFGTTVQVAIYELKEVRHAVNQTTLIDK